MPQIGDIAIGKSIGKGNKRDYYVWVECPICQQGRWRSKSEIKKSKRSQSCLNRCHPCAVSQKGDKCPNWKGGRRIERGGYILIYVPEEDFFASMRNSQGYIREHRLVMAKHLGRNLHRWEIVHHRNHIRDDNRIENLQLVSSDRHDQITALERRITSLEGQLCDLRGLLLTLGVSHQS